MKNIQFVLSIMVTMAMIIILVYDDSGRMLLRWLAAGVGFAALAFIVLLFFTQADKNKDKTDTDI
jgi:bacteriorhodopsin